ncbi:MAG: cytochrome b [Burkholderiales bacterium]
MKTQNYSFGAVILHWLIATSILFLFALSWWMMSLPWGEGVRGFPFQLHKNLGLTLVLLTGLLLYIRFRHSPGRLPDSMSSWTKKMAMLDHILVYALILVVCVSGYLSSSYSGWGTTWWWLIELPNWGYENEELNVLYSDIHIYSCWALLALLAAHISGALYHAFLRDGVVRRMLHL